MDGLSISSTGKAKQFYAAVYPKALVPAKGEELSPDQLDQLHKSAVMIRAEKKGKDNFSIKIGAPQEQGIAIFDQDLNLTSTNLKSREGNTSFIENTLGITEKFLGSLKSVLSNFFKSEKKSIEEQ